MEFFNAQNLLDLGMLVFLQAVLGFDNLLYISLESKRAPEQHQKQVRKWGILIAIGLRIGLLFLLMSLLKWLSEPLFSIYWTGILEGEFPFSTLVFLLGGGFIMYTAVKEIHHLIATENLNQNIGDNPSKSATQVVALIVFMNLIFSFDSILSALAITKVFFILATAIVASGLAMLLLADRVSEFLEKNRMYEVLGLFILLIVGIVLLGEGGHEGHVKLFGYAIEPISKTTFYFSIAVLFVVELLQTKYQKKLHQTTKT